MRAKTVIRHTTKRGSRDYVELEGSNKRYESIMIKLSEDSYEGISKPNQAVLKDFLQDMGKGRYISQKSKKGPRSYKRLVKLFYVLSKIIKLMDNRVLTKITEDELHAFFDDLNSDKIRKANGEPYKDKRDFKKDFSTFWHWHMIKTFKTTKKRIPDIVEYINTPMQSRPDFVFFTLDQLKHDILTNTNNEDIKSCLMILFDTGARPSEFYNLKRKDISFSKDDDKVLIDIPEEISKTYGRKIKLHLTSHIMKQYLDRHDLKREDFVFLKFRYNVKEFLYSVNKAKSVKKLTKDVEKNLSHYDFRHSGTCYYLERYKNASDMKFRYGWKKESMIEYYTRFMGKQDFLSEEDMLSPEDKTKIEIELLEERKKREDLENHMNVMEERMKAFEKIMMLQSGQKDKIILTEDEAKAVSTDDEDYAKFVLKTKRNNVYD